MPTLPSTPSPHHPDPHMVVTVENPKAMLQHHPLMVHIFEGALSDGGFGLTRVEFNYCQFLKVCDLLLTTHYFLLAAYYLLLTTGYLLLTTDHYYYFHFLKNCDAMKKPTHIWGPERLVQVRDPAACA